MLTYLTTHLQTYTKRLRRDDRGAALVEYGLLVALIAVIVVPALILLGPAIRDMFQGIIPNL